jgi:hypothetical protein
LVLLGTSQPIEFDPVTVPDAIIRYTIDGSDPTPTSAVYKGAIRLNRDGQVRAAIFRPNGTHSAVTTIAAVSIRPDESAKIAGINRRVLDGVFAKCPDPSAFQAVVAKNVASVGLGEYAGRDNYALQFDGFLRIPADGEYTFYLGSDDGSKMWLGDQLVADNDGLHAFGEKRLKLNLPKGDYPFRIVMFEQGGSESLRFSVEAMGQTKQLVPDAWYWSKG